MTLDRRKSKTLFDTINARKIAWIGGVLIACPGVSTAWAQPRANAAGDAAGCAACGLLGSIAILIPIAILALNIALLVWVARDAKSRGMDSAVLWMILVMCTSLVGLLIYVLARPQGELIQCAHCNNRRMRASAKCPHCGNT